MIIVAEIGLNHNGDIEIAKQMIRMANAAGCNFVKFQKRTVGSVYSKEELDRPRESPWGTTNRQQKHGLEFGRKEYHEIDNFCTVRDIGWFASPWDVDSVDFLLLYSPPYIKVASACLTQNPLLKHIQRTGIPVIVSTGMSTKAELDGALNILGDQVEYILACTSTYPCPPEEINLKFISTLQREYPQYKIGFSNHSPGLTFCIAAAALGAEMIEFHMTLDRSMYGSDQAASIEVPGMTALGKHLPNVQCGMGSGEWTVFAGERKALLKLRRDQ